MNPNSVAGESTLPQVSVLGPSLFLFYVNDVAESFMNKVRLIGDDTIAYLEVLFQADVKMTLTSDFGKLTTCVQLYCMEFHPQKALSSFLENRIHLYTTIYFTKNVLEHTASAKYLE